MELPWWIWIALSAVVLGGIVVFALKYQKADDEQYRPYRHDGSKRRRSRRRSRDGDPGSRRS